MEEARVCAEGKERERLERVRGWRTYGDPPERWLLLRTGPTSPGALNRSSKDAIILTESRGGELGGGGTGILGRAEVISSREATCYILYAKKRTQHSPCMDGTPHSERSLGVQT